MAILLTLALYLSGFFIILTPLPMLYSLLKRRFFALLEVGLPVLIILAVLYVFAVPPLHAFYKAHPQWSWLVSAPGLDLVDWLNPHTITLFGLSYYLFFAGSACAVFTGFSEKLRPFPYIFTSAFVFMVLGLVFYRIYSMYSGEGVGSIVLKYLETVMEQILLLQKESNAPPEQIALLGKNMDGFIRYFVLLLPSVVFCAIFVTLAVNYLLGKRFFFALLGNRSLPKFGEWSFPFFGVWFTIAAIGAYLANSYFLKSPFLSAVSGNLLVIFSFVYYVSGLSILSFFFDKKGVRPFARVLVYGLVFLLFQTVGFVVLGAGFFDSWFNFRKLSAK